MLLTPGISTGDWKLRNKPLWERSSGSKENRSLPRNWAVPSVTSYSGCPTSTLDSVLLPEPFLPMMACTSPCLVLKGGRRPGVCEVHTTNLCVVAIQQTTPDGARRTTTDITPPPSHLSDGQVHAVENLLARRDDFRSQALDVQDHLAAAGCMGYRGGPTSCALLPEQGGAV
eukprot:1160907-Pelagomonas_calceolata.AAC.4